MFPSPRYFGKSAVVASFSFPLFFFFFFFSVLLFFSRPSLLCPEFPPIVCRGLNRQLEPSGRTAMEHRSNRTVAANSQPFRGSWTSPLWPGGQIKSRLFLTKSILSSILLRFCKKTHRVNRSIAVYANRSPGVWGLRLAEQSRLAYIGSRLWHTFFFFFFSLRPQFD